MKIIVVGGRDYRSFTLGKILKLLNPSIVVTGCAHGADHIARDYAKVHNLLLLEFKADWSTHGKAAGPIRNRAMMEAHKDASFVLAAPGGRGTDSSIKIAKELGIPILRLE